MRRRDVLKLSAGAAMLAAPHIATAQREQTLRFVPTPDLILLDPVWAANRATHVHAHLVFDTLYGLDKTFAAHPQMAEGHVVENDGTVWTLRLREGLRFHDGEPGTRTRRGGEYPALDGPRWLRSVTHGGDWRTVRAG